MEHHFDVKSIKEISQATGLVLFIILASGYYFLKGFVEYIIMGLYRFFIQENPAN